MPNDRMYAVLPTLMTLGNAACGFGAITFAAKVGPEPVNGQSLLVAASLIFLGMVFDMLDGGVARLTNQTSEFGAQLDSLCDAISFGVAPAFLMIQFTRQDHTFGGAAPELFNYHPKVLWVIGVLFAVCAILRLARFNVETEEDDSHDFFSGLPSPAAAGTVASFPIAMYGLRDLVAPDAGATALAVGEWLVPIVKIAVPLITLATAGLMVSRIRYSHVFNQLFRGKKNRMHLIQLVFTFAIVYMVKELAVPLIFCTFAFAAPIRAGWRESVASRFQKTREAKTG